MKLINGTVIANHWVEYGAELEPGTVIDCDDEQEAIDLTKHRGKVLVKHVFETAYAERAA